MIWIDSSFAIEWLLGTERAKKVDIARHPIAILPMQYLETAVFFLRTGADPLKTLEVLEALELKNPEKFHLKEAAALYLKARESKSKASLADAILAAVGRERGEPIASFDKDFVWLGLKERGGLWTIE